MRTRPKSARLKAALPPDAVELIRPYLLGETTEAESQRVEALAADNPTFASEVERRRWLMEEMDHVYGERKITDGFQQTAERKLTESAERGGVSDEELPDEEELVAAQPAGFLDSLSAQFGAAPWWLISGAFHALVLLLVTLIGMAILRNHENETVIVTDLVKQKRPDEIETPKERTVIPKPIPIEDSEVETDQQPIVTHEEVEIADQVETDNDSDFNETRGEDGISDVWLGGSGTVAALGLGGGGGGAFGRPNGRGGRLRRAIRGGGGRATESAVDKALEWLARNQEAAGYWDGMKHGANLKVDPGLTGLAVLAFLGAGHTEKVGKFKVNVQRAVQWIISQQRADGAIGTDPAFKENHGGFAYHHSICGMALAEAAAMGRVQATRAAAQRAINYSCELHQFGQGSNRLGWRYKPKTREADLSVTGWFVMQLKSAKVAGLQVDPASFDGAIKFLDMRMAAPVNVKKRTGDDTYDNGGHRYGYTNRKPAVNTTSIGILCRLFTGSRPAEVQGAARWLLQTNPPVYHAQLGPGGVGSYWPMYYLYYTTLTMFQTGGDLWKTWNATMKKSLVAAQRRGGPEDGSWDPFTGEDKYGGRVMTTALGAMCLEVYYRYLPLYRGK